MRAFYKVKTIEEQKEFWNTKAKPCSCFERRSAYADEFLKLSGICEGESVFDMGCGSGTLCLPLADDGHKVFCADFSENMLKSVQDVIEEEKITLLTLQKLSWQEDWNAYDLPVCDLAFASRCMFGVDPEESIKKLSGQAKRRVCITLPVNATMFEGGNAPYSIGSADELNAFADACIQEVSKLGFDPIAEYMKGTEGKESRWLFVSWNIT